MFNYIFYEFLYDLKLFFIVNLQLIEYLYKKDVFAFSFCKKNFKKKLKQATHEECHLCKCGYESPYVKAWN